MSRRLVASAPHDVRGPHFTPPARPPGRDRALIRVPRDAPTAGRASASLARLGGVAIGVGADFVFAFASEADRDAALDQVRRAYGWTCAERQP